jgi:hypothetical protein
VPCLVRAGLGMLPQGRVAPAGRGGEQPRPVHRRSVGALESGRYQKTDSRPEGGAAPLRVRTLRDPLFSKITMAVNGVVQMAL